jgi:phosphoglycerate dehydrogenase-like enzyme
MRIFIYGEYEDWQKTFLKEKLPDSIQISWGRELPAQPDYQILVWGRPNEEWLAEAADLQYLIVPYAGIPIHTLALLKKYPHLHLHNLHHNALPTAEMAFSLLLAAAKNIIPAHNKLQKGDWTPRYEGLANRLIAGRNVLIMGYGSVGRHLADMCAGMKTRIFSTRNNCPEVHLENNVEIHPAGDLESLLPAAQIILLTLPLTAGTKNILNRKRLELLPEDAILVNIGRGGLIEEKALYELLKSGRIAAAGLDVWYNYPAGIAERQHTYPGNLPFHELNNVVLSPHRGGAFANYDTELLRVQHLADMLLKHLQTGKMPNQVDLNRGY